MYAAIPRHSEKAQEGKNAPGIHFIVGQELPIRSGVDPTANKH